jgi:hypothetical protein
MAHAVRPYLIRAPCIWAFLISLDKRRFQEYRENIREGWPMEQDQGFFWQRHAGAEQLCLKLLDGFRENVTLARFEEQLISQTSGRLLDWIDHLLVHDSAQLRDELAALGFVNQRDLGHQVYYHPAALLPRILLTGNSSGPDAGVALRVECIADFLQANGFTAEIEGEPLGSYRRGLITAQRGIALQAVERRGSSGFDPVTMPEDYLRNYFSALELWQTRPRTGENEELAMTEAVRLAAQLAAHLGPDLAAHIICQGERSHWLSRNFAGRVQKSRQDTLGLGWGNHDHHTFRSSRHNFARLVKLFSGLGFRNRERFYAGEEAGWGAQVMENQAAGLTLFLDVDLAPEEVATDFSQEELPEREELGTVGLWCALHGDSILGAGMHHVAAQYDFDRLIADLARHGVGYMAPFSDFPYLRQAFSIAERWAVDPQRVANLVREKRISTEQGEKFLAGGAVGSHLENIQRREGYKGFNKKNVSAIIRETDPRK